MNCDSPGTCEGPEIKKGEGSFCPKCGSRSKKVSAITVRYMVRGIFQSGIDEARLHRFCLSPECSVVYFSEDGKAVFTKDQLTERVTVKETEDPLPICYCFNFFRHDVEREIKATGRTTIPDFISSQVKAGNCFCEYTNPQGTCCLGNVAAAVKQLQKKEDGS